MFQLLCRDFSTTTFDRRSPRVVRSARRRELKTPGEAFYGNPASSHRGLRFHPISVFFCVHGCTRPRREENAGNSRKRPPAESVTSKRRFFNGDRGERRNDSQTMAERSSCTHVHAGPADVMSMIKMLDERSSENARSRRTNIRTKKEKKKRKKK